MPPGDHYSLEGSDYLVGRVEREKRGKYPVNNASKSRDNQPRRPINGEPSMNPVGLRIVGAGGMGGEGIHSGRLGSRCRCSAMNAIRWRNVLPTSARKTIEKHLPMWSGKGTSTPLMESKPAHELPNASCGFSFKGYIHLNISIRGTAA